MIPTDDRAQSDGEVGPLELLAVGLLLLLLIAGLIR